MASCYENGDKFRPDGPFGSNADLTYQDKLLFDVDFAKISGLILARLFSVDVGSISTVSSPFFAAVIGAYLSKGTEQFNSAIIQVVHAA